MLVSVIIPTRNHAARAVVFLRRVAEHPDVELIVVDGESTDSTRTVAEQFTPYVFCTRPDLATQLNVGARHATGDVLLFLPPDTFLLDGALEDMQRRLIGAGAVAGAFDLRLDSPRRSVRVIEQLLTRWARFWRTPRVAQGLFVWRQVFEKVGGFPAQPVRADIALARRLRRQGRFAFVPAGLVSSAAEWHAQGPVRWLAVQMWVGTLARLGVPARELLRIEAGWRRPKTLPAHYRPAIVRLKGDRS